MTEDECKKRELALYNSDKKEYLEEKGICTRSFGYQNVAVHDIKVDIYENDSIEIVAMKVRNAIEGKEFIEGEFINHDQKLLDKIK